MCMQMSPAKHRALAAKNVSHRTGPTGSSGISHMLQVPEPVMMMLLFRPSQSISRRCVTGSTLVLSHLESVFPWPRRLSLACCIGRLPRSLARVLMTVLLAQRHLPE